MAKPPTPAQKTARARNWEKFQLLGIRSRYHVISMSEHSPEFRTQLNKSIADLEHLIRLFEQE